MVMTYDVNAIRKDFPILSTTVYDRPLIYLDNAATTHKKYRRKWLNNSKQFSEKKKRISKENECLTKER